MDVAELGFAINSDPAAQAADNLDKMAGASKRAQTATERMQAQVDRTTASVREYMAFAKEIHSYLQSEAKDLEDVADRRYGYNAALKAGILTQKEYVDALKALDKQEAVLGRAAASTKDAIDKTTGSFKLSGGAARELGVMVGEVARGNFARLEGSAITLANRMNLMPMIFSGVGIAIMAIVAAVGAFVAAIISGYREQKEFQRIVIATGGAIGVTAGQLNDMAHNIGAATGNYAGATAALMKLANTGKFTGEQLGIAARGAVALATVAGESADKAAAEIEKFADKPTEAALKANDAYHFLTAAVFEHIQALERQGQTQEATTTLVSAFTTEMERRAPLVEDTAGIMERAWNKVRDAVSGAWQAMKDVGRTDLEGRIANVKRQISDVGAVLDQYRRGQNGAGGLDRVAYAIGSVTGGYDRNVNMQDALIKKLKALEDERAALDATTASQAKYQRVQDEAVVIMHRLGDELVAHADKQTKLAVAIARVKEEFAKLRAPESGITSINGMSLDVAEALRIKQLNEQYKDTSNSAKKLGRDTLAAANAMDALSGFADQLGGKMGGPLDAAMQEYNANLARADQLADDALIKGNELKDVIDAHTLAYKNAEGVLDKRIEKIAEESDVEGRLIARLGAEITVRGKHVTALKAEQLVLKAVADAGMASVMDNSDVDALKRKVEALLKLAEFAGKYQPKETPIQRMNNDLAEMRDLLEKLPALMGDAFDPEHAEQLKKEIAEANKQLNRTKIELAQGIVAGANESLRSLQSMTREGGKSFQALQVAIDATTLAEAVLAVVHQLSGGDVYSAIPRAAAVAAAIAALGVDIGHIKNSGFSDSAAQRQATQGAGSVLGNSETKSESIAKAVEITAQATTMLVALNRGMLTALQALQSALGAAGNQLARGAGQVDFSGMQLAVRSFDFKDPLTQMLLGGSSKLTDQGIVIFGGALTDLLNSVAVGAYQEVQSRSWLFGSTHTNTGIKDVSGEFGKQFQLVISSIVDTVRAGALALGMPPKDVEDALAAYRVEEIKISLKGLSAEEQQKELQAVFGKLFDGLAGTVVPYIDQFQRVGEGLGETLVRVATEVQVVQEGFRQLGRVFGTTDPERVAQISDALITATGGIESFVSGMQSFVSKFASDQHQFDVASAALSSAFEQVGLVVPTTRDGMWDLMQSLDETTDSGRAQIATLLRLADVANSYYSMIDKQTKDQIEAQEALRRAVYDYQQLIAGLDVELGANTGFIAARREIEEWERSTIAQANALAVAAGRQGAAEQDLVKIHGVAAQRVAQLIEKLRASARDFAQQLGYVGQQDTLDYLNQQIASLQSASSSAADAIGSAVDSMRQKMNLLLGDLSPFSDQRKLEMALEGLRAGTVDAQQVLEIGRRLYASTSNYTNLFNQVMGQSNFGAVNPGAVGQSNLGADSRSLNELIAARDAILQAQRPELADQLARRIAELSVATGDDYADLARQMGFGLDRLAGDLSLSDQQLLDYLAQLSDQFEAQDWADVGDMITGAINLSADRIVAAIVGESPVVATAADTRMAEIADKQAAGTEEISDRLDALAARIDSQTSATLSSDASTTAELLGELRALRQEMREDRLLRQADWSHRMVPA